MSRAPITRHHSDDWPDAETLGRRLRNLRRIRGLAQADVTDGAVTAAHLSRIEAGERYPSLDVLAVFAERLGTPVDALLAPVDEPADGLPARAYAAERVALRAAAWLADPTNTTAYAGLVEAVAEWDALA